MSELRAFIFQLRIQDAYFLQRCADQLWLGLLRARPFFLSANMSKDKQCLASWVSGDLAIAVGMAASAVGNHLVFYGLKNFCCHKEILTGFWGLSD
ncbi:hypothetical protein [Collimonas fungivorans]|uniref:hypothetical protein n=1 Tax=Collimonas fungivorans TaxID=158899 RepID=UPI001EE65885|nr:hypothetical protein [Collimonas fungivorans]